MGLVRFKHKFDKETNLGKVGLGELCCHVYLNENKVKDEAQNQIFLL